MGEDLAFEHQLGSNLMVLLDLALRLCSVCVGTEVPLFSKELLSLVCSSEEAAADLELKDRNGGGGLSAVCLLVFPRPH